MKKNKGMVLVLAGVLAVADAMGTTALAEMMDGEEVVTEYYDSEEPAAEEPAQGNAQPEMDTFEEYPAHDEAYYEEEYYEEYDEEYHEEDTEEETETETKPPEQDIENTLQKKRVSDFKLFRKADAERVFELCAFEELPQHLYLDVPKVLQKPELPTGCESVSLTMALMYEGFELDKVDIAHRYLIYNREDDNLALGYVGDPFSEEGAGCFPPAITATADAFFEENEVDYDAYDISGTSINELLSYIAGGTPVIVWTTMYMMEPEFTEEVGKYDGKEYPWFTSEHCVVISGYNLENRTLQINDPLEGIMQRSLDDFERLYEITGEYAVVLRERQADDLTKIEEGRKADKETEKSSEKESEFLILE